MARKPKPAPPPLPVRRKAGGKGGLGVWYQTGRDEWYADANDGDIGGRVRLSKGKWRGAGETYFAYRGGLYLGREDALPAAQKLVESNKRRPSATPEDHAPLNSVHTTVEETEEEKKARLTRASMKSDRVAPKRRNGRGAVVPAGTHAIRLKITANPRRLGSGAHTRFELLMKYNGRSVSEFLAGGGNPKTLTNAIEQGIAETE